MVNERRDRRTALSDVFLMVRRKKTTIFLDAKESTTVYDVKRMVAGITKHPPEQQQLIDIKDHQPMENEKTLVDYNYTSATARPMAPANIGLCFLGDDGHFEPLDITPFSLPPELPDSMKPSESQPMDGGEQN